MKTILKIVLFFSLISSLYANIDEYKSDVYYANGVLINISEAKAEKKWIDKIEELFVNNPEISKKISHTKMAYNRSQKGSGLLGSLKGVFDYFESLDQMLNNELDWGKFSILYKEYLKDNFENYNPSFHDEDLTKQVNAYKQSIKNGHGVIVIAHSQGNYFTNEAYDKLDDWMKDYFHMFGVATPANHVAGYGADDITAPYVKFHNDIIKVVLTGLESNRDDPNLEHNSVMSLESHDFYTSYMTAENTKNDITNFITIKLDDHIKAPSQWKTKEELNYGTKEYRIKVEHMFDPSVTVDSEVFPFDPAKKLYFVEDPYKTYVKGGFGGTKILDFWEGQKEEQFYKLEGTDPIEYIKFTCKDPSTFEILSHQNINTKEWRVTVKNKDTNETQEGVYPFNLEGSLYQLDSGEWVLASCGGYEIESTWSGQKDREIFILIGTGEIINIVCEDGFYWDYVTEACVPYENQATYILDETNGEISDISFYASNRNYPIADDYILLLEAGTIYHAIDYSNTKNCAGTVLSLDININNYFTQATFDAMVIKEDFGRLSYQGSWTPTQRTIIDQFGLPPVNTPIIANILEDLIATIPHDTYKVVSEIAVADSYHEKSTYGHFNTYIGISGGKTCGGSLIPNEPYPRYINPNAILTKVKYYFRNKTKREVTFYWKD